MANTCIIENSKRRNHSGGPEVDVSVLLAYVDLIAIWYLQGVKLDLYESGRVQLWAVVKMVMNLQILQRR
jgi:hypothetical protein